MTVNSGLGVITYIADGETKNFAYPYKFFDDELAVYKNKSFETYQKNTDYIITGSGNPSGGEISFMTAPKKGEYITITRDIILNQLVQFIEGEDFPASDYEYSLDRIIMILQQFEYRLQNTWQIAPGNTQPESFINELTQKIETLSRQTQKFGPQTIPLSSWSEDKSLNGYSFSATITLPDITTDMIPLITFGIDDANSNNFAPLAETITGGIKIFAKEQPLSEVIIESIICQ